MPGTIVTAAHTDSVRIEAADGRVVQLPAAAILAADRVLRHCLESGESLEVRRVACGWQADADYLGEVAATPCGAIIALAEVIEGRQR